MNPRTAADLRDALTALTLRQADRRSDREDDQGGAALADALDRIEALARALPADAPAELRHFLERRSYVKARQWLEANADR